jgi:ABC-type sugar transport system ATPase subunit
MYVATNIKKHYGGVKALDGVDLEVRPGEVHALLGANGAGKSTLVKILVGAEQPTEGKLTLNGEEVGFQNLGEAADSGIAIVSQELNLFPDFDVLHNLFLLREPLAGGLLIDRAEMRRRAEPVAEAVGLDVSFDRKVGTLRLGEQQLVEIARALLNDPKILFLDEPTSALQGAETARLLDVVRRLRDRGVAIVYVSHFLSDVFAIADTITILRNGKAVAEQRDRETMSIPETVAQMLGEAGEARRRMVADDPMADREPANTAPLKLDGVSVRNLLQPTTLQAGPGEVVGLAGLDGSGAHTVLNVIFGRHKLDSGTVTLPSGALGPTGMTNAVRAGIAYVPADRNRLGLMLHKPLFENVATVTAGPLRRMGVILRNQRLLDRAEHWCGALKIKTPTTRTLVGELSGGNQQKVVFAKWLETDPRVVLLDDPSRGVDVGAKAEMHRIIAQMSARKRIILYTSNDMEEMAEVCDRVIVFFQGRACGELGGDELSEHRLLEAINTGVVNTERVAS